MEPSTGHYFDSAVWLDGPRVSEQNAHYLAHTWEFTGLDQRPRETRILPREPWAAQCLRLRGCCGAPAGALRLQRVLSAQSPAWRLSGFLSLPERFRWSLRPFAPWSTVALRTRAGAGRRPPKVLSPEPVNILVYLAKGALT